jgi:hypothetical protein
VRRASCSLKVAESAGMLRISDDLSRQEIHALTPDMSQNGQKSDLAQKGTFA